MLWLRLDVLELESILGLYFPGHQEFFKLSEVVNSKTYNSNIEATNKKLILTSVSLTTGGGAKLHFFFSMIIIKEPEWSYSLKPIT